MTHLYWLDQIRPNQLTFVGFKAFYLSHLGQNGCPVIPGFVVSAQVLQAVLEQMSWTVPLFADLPGSALRLNIDNPHQLQAIAQDLQQGIRAAQLPAAVVAELTAAIAQLAAPTLILRPSLIVETASVPGALGFGAGGQSSSLFESRVVAGNAIAVGQGIQQIWANLFTAKSLFYWQRLDIPWQQVKLAILVQPIQSAIAAGTLQAGSDYLELEATVGLGTALVRGEVMPDRYQLDPVTGRLHSKQLGQRSLAYQIADATLQPVWLTDSQRQTDSLTDAIVPVFAPLLQQATTALGLPVVLEWVLPANAPEPSQPFITQVLPQLATAAREPAIAPSPTVKKNLELFPGATLLATGLAAAGGQAIAPACVITDISLPPDEITPHTVWVTPSIPLNWLPQLSQAAALVSAQGSLTSHSAIVARELGVPAVMGVPQLPQQIQSGELLWVDGDRGRVYRLESTAAVPSPIRGNSPAEFARLAARPQLQTQLMVNLSQPEQATQTAALPVDGVGLLRAELLALGIFQGQSPQLWLQQHSAPLLVEKLTTAIAQFAVAFYPRPVFYRSLDWREHELAIAGQVAPATPDGALGVRGTFSYTLDDKLFSLELQALRAVQQAGYPNLRLILPFVRTVSEFEFCYQRVQQAGLLTVGEFALWIMAEVPAVIWLLPELVRAGVQGISIGTNDLTQLILGANRDQAVLAENFTAQNLAVQRAIAQLIDSAQTLGLPCAICGEAPVRYPDCIADWVRRGIHSISVAPEAVESTYQALLAAEHASF